MLWVTCTSLSRRSTTLPRIAIDVDGVLADFSRGFIEAYNMTTHDMISPDALPTSWYWNNLMTKAEFDRGWKAAMATENYWLGLPPLKGAAELDHASLTLHAELVFLTSRGSSAGMSVH